jgi:hypothetical protein
MGDKWVLRLAGNMIRSPPLEQSQNMISNTNTTDLVPGRLVIALGKYLVNGDFHTVLAMNGRYRQCIQPVRDWVCNTTRPILNLPKTIPTKTDASQT